MNCSCLGICAQWRRRGTFHTVGASEDQSERAFRSERCALVLACACVILVESWVKWWGYWSWNWVKCQARLWPVLIWGQCVSLNKRLRAVSECTRASPWSTTWGRLRTTSICTLTTRDLPSTMRRIMLRTWGSTLGGLNTTCTLKNLSNFQSGWLELSFTTMSIGSKVKTGHQRRKGIGLGEIQKNTLKENEWNTEFRILWWFI